jgi:hypothetical protein
MKQPIALGRCHVNHGQLLAERPSDVIRVRIVLLKGQTLLSKLSLYRKKALNPCIS